MSRISQSGCEIGFVLRLGIQRRCNQLSIVFCYLIKPQCQRWQRRWEAAGCEVYGNRPLSYRLVHLVHNVVNPERTHRMFCFAGFGLRSRHLTESNTLFKHHKGRKSECHLSICKDRLEESSTELDGSSLFESVLDAGNTLCIKQYELSVAHIFLLHARQLNDFGFSQWDLSCESKIRYPETHIETTRKSLQDDCPIGNGHFGVPWSYFSGGILSYLGVYPLLILHSYGQWPIYRWFPIKNGDFP